MKVAATLGSLLITLTSCGQGERPFRMVQFCLHDEQDISRFKTVAQLIAQANRLEFTDRSAESQAEGEEIAKTEPAIKVARPTITVSAHRSDGMGFGVGNFAEAPTQVVIGFSKGADEAEAKEFAASVVQSLEKRWVVKEVPRPDLQGAFPLRNCEFVTPTV